MVTLYFSGTGNSKFVAERLAAGMGGECHSIEAPVNFGALLRDEDMAAFVYPIYCSRVPRILREFVQAHLADLLGKKLVILCTQMGFSGDGARCFTDLLPKRLATVRYAEHITMPNNINNFRVFPQTRAARQVALVRRAEQTIARICEDLKAGKVFRRGFNPLSRLLGLIQGVWMPLVERVSNDAVSIGSECTGCGLCVRSCPMQNLTLAGGKAQAHGNCTQCYRCSNLCPSRAIRIYFKQKVNWQFQGIQNRP